jgi:hypothetical protein
MQRMKKKKEKENQRSFDSKLLHLDCPAAVVHERTREGEYQAYTTQSRQRKYKDRSIV